MKLILLGIALGSLAAMSTANGEDLQAPEPRWATVWRDDFEGQRLDRAKWNAERSCWGGGNNERQCYTDRAANIQVSDGVLRLIARPERYTGPLYPRELRRLGNGRKEQRYTSGKIRTLGLAGWRYGRVSARMLLPAGQGAWPAFWMMPVEPVYGDWPLSGEIDIMEAVNLGTPCADCVGGVEWRTSGALHFGDLAPDNTYWFAKDAAPEASNPTETWRTYAVEWAEGVIQWFVDDRLFLRLESADWFTNSSDAAGREHAPFDQPFYIMLNLAVGGRLAEESNGGGFEPDTFPAELRVDWVHVEQCEGDEATGRACLTQQAWAGTPLGPWEVQAR